MVLLCLCGLRGCEISVRHCSVALKRSDRADLPAEAPSDLAKVPRFGVKESKVDKLPNLTTANAIPKSRTPGRPGMIGLGDNFYEYRRGPFLAHKYTKFHEALVARFDEMGEFYTEMIGGTSYFFIADPDAFKIVFDYEATIENGIPIRQPQLETGFAFSLRESSDKHSPGFHDMSSLNGERWLHLKRNVHSLCLPAKSAFDLLPQIEPIADRLIDLIRESKSSDEIRDFRPLAAHWNINNAAMTIFGRDFGVEGFESQLGQSIIDARKRISELSTRLKFSLYLYKLFETPKSRTIRQNKEFLLSVGFRSSNELLSAAISDMERDSGSAAQKYPLLARFATRDALEYEDIQSVCFSMFTEGLTKTAPTFVKCLYTLATHPKLQERVRSELKGVLGSDPLTPESLSSLTFLKACIKETLRLYPARTGISRVAQRSMVICGYEVLPGYHLELCNYPLLRSPDFFDSPLEFDPDRWLKGGSAMHAHPMLMLPFGHGRRFCLGRRFAEQEVLLGLAKVLLNFNVGWASSNPMELEYYFELLPDSGHFSFKDL